MYVQIYMFYNTTHSLTHACGNNIRFTISGASACASIPTWIVYKMCVCVCVCAGRHVFSREGSLPGDTFDGTAKTAPRVQPSPSVAVSVRVCCWPLFAEKKRVCVCVCVYVCVVCVCVLRATKKSWICDVTFTERFSTQKWLNSACYIKPGDWPHRLAARRVRQDVARGLWELWNEVVVLLAVEVSNCVCVYVCFALRTRFACAVRE